MSYQLDYAGLIPYLPHFVAGVWTTVQLTVISTVAGLVAGTLCKAAGRISKQRWLLRMMCSCYIELTRNTPFIVQLFFIFFGLLRIGSQIKCLGSGCDSDGL
ncbi:ABC transporter permease subunit [Vibrio sp. PP-XX7]